MPVSFPRIDIFSVIIFAGVVQGFFLTIIYLLKENNRYRANVYIGLLFLVLSLYRLEILFKYSGLIFKMLWLDNFSEPFIFLIGPLFYLHVRCLLKSEQKHTWLHFVWFVAYALYHILYLIQPLDFKFNSVNLYYGYNLPYKMVQMVVDPDPFLLRKYVNEIFEIHLLGYLFLSTSYVVKKFRANGLKIYSQVKDKKTWVRNLLLKVWTGFIIFVIVHIIFGRGLGDYLVATYMTVVMYITTFYLVKKSIALKPAAENVESIANTSKYQKSSLKNADKEIIINKLDSLMKESKVFKNNLLSLNELSKKACVPSHHLSQVINETTGKTFFEYLALFRVEEAKRILSLQSNNATIEEIAEEVGYNSKSAFNKIFKKHTGLTPTEYRENRKSQRACL